MSTIRFTKIGSTFPKGASDGDIVTYVTPPGVVLQRLAVTGEIETVATSSPFTHAGATCTYLVECVALPTEYVDAELDIQRPPI